MVGGRAAHGGAGGSVEEELTRLIERRSGRDPDPDELAPSYAESVGRFHDSRRRERRAGWYAHHEHMRELHEGLAREHGEKARALLAREPPGEARKTG